MQNSDTLTWVKSSYSVQNACVEVAVMADGGRAVRDSKNPSGPIHVYTKAEWVAFIAGVKGGEFDL